MGTVTCYLWHSPLVINRR